MTLEEKDRCPDCRAWHGIPPLEHLSPSKPCSHDPTRPCVICRQPVGALSVGGYNVCGWCDCDEEREDTKK